MKLFVRNPEGDVLSFVETGDIFHTIMSSLRDYDIRVLLRSVATIIHNPEGVT